MNIWYILNGLILIFAISKVAMKPISAITFFGLLGFLFIMFNWTRQAVFKTIRDSPYREQKIRFANFSKRVLPLHKWNGTIALILILIHSIFVIQMYGLLLTNKKIITELFAIIFLIFLVVYVCFRWLKTTPIRRYVHWGLGFTIFFLIIVHIIL